MKGLLLHNEAETEKNRFFIDSIIRSASDNGIDMKLCTSAADFDYDEDFAINRSRSFLAARELEEHGIRVFNDSFLSETANDKWNTYEYLHNKLPMAETLPAEKNCPFPYPAVVKPRHGHGGRNVFLVNSDSEYDRALDIISETVIYDFTGSPVCEEAIVQPCLDTGRDLRVYIIGNEIIASVMRTSETDFRSNYSLGGKAELFSPDFKITEYVLQAAELTAPDFAAFDFIFSGNSCFLNEIEDAAGYRMLYSNTQDINIPDKMIQYILANL